MNSRRVNPWSKWQLISKSNCIILQETKIWWKYFSQEKKKSRGPYGGLETSLFFTRPSRGQNSLEIKGWICSKLSNQLQGAYRGHELCFSLWGFPLFCWMVFVFFDTLHQRTTFSVYALFTYFLLLLRFNKTFYHYY